jgi:hypothetical protein
VQEAIARNDDEEIRRIDEELAALAKPISFRDWVNRGLAVFICPHDYSSRDLILAIAQQYGSSHEDDSVEEGVIHLRQFFIGGESGDIAPLISVADSVISVGASFMAFMAETHGFKPRYFGMESA